MGEKLDLYKTPNYGSKRISKQNENAHRLANAYKLFVIKASNP